ncbi:MAG: DUF1254 domain-containing protein [Rhizomicrobium sp.]
MGDNSAKALIAAAVEYGWPVFEVARLSYDFSYNPANPRRTPVNRLAHRRILSDHRHRLVTTPNHDTLYSSAILDLSAGPVTLNVPAFGRRYYSLAFMDAYTNAFAYVGSRTAGGEGGCYLVLGPDWHGKVPAPAAIRAPGNHASLLARIRVEDSSHYPEVHRLQDGLHLSGPEVSRPDLIVPRQREPENFIAIVNQVLRSDPPPPTDAPLLNRLAPIGMGEAHLTPQQKTWWRLHFAASREALIQAGKHLGPSVHGWQYPPASVGDFGTDYRTRAIIAIQGLAANVSAESVYALGLADQQGGEFDGRYRYRFTLPPGTPPARAFWSLSLYEGLPDGGLYFVDNPLHRYALGSATDGLKRGEGGALDILIGKDRPSDIANWLPAPSGPFALMMRAYLPGDEMRDGRFRYPGIERLD